VTPDLSEAGLRAPAIIAKAAHRRLGSFTIGSADQNRGCDHVVAVTENIGFHGQLVAYGSLHSEAATVDFRGDTFDGDPALGGAPEQPLCACLSGPSARSPFFASYQLFHTLPSTGMERSRQNPKVRIKSVFRNAGSRP
jgi:hypothetical protein